MSSLVDVPAQLALALTLAAGAPEPPPLQAPAAAISHQVDLRFTEQSWLAGLKAHGAELGHSEAATRIFRTSSGRYYVPVPEERQAILTLRHKAHIALPLAARLARANAEALRQRLGRAPTAADLYLAHVWTLEIAAGMIEAADRQAAAPVGGRAGVASLRPNTWSRGWVTTVRPTSRSSQSSARRAEASR